MRNPPRLVRFIVSALLVLGLNSTASAQWRRTDTGRYRLLSFSWRRLPANRRPNLNIKGQTLGGTQFWSDELIFDSWRIQRNVITDHYRLLDDKNVRRAWGSNRFCREALTQFSQSMKLKPPGEKVVIVLHGLCRTRSTMDAVCDSVKKGGYTPINVSYASTRLPIDKHAQALAKIIANLKDVKEISFVAHSMGNLVVRHYLGDQQRAGVKDPRIKRFVMLGPPNHGAALARRFKDNELVKVVWGHAGDQLAEWKKLEAQLATPSFQFGIIAGGRGKNPLIPGDDDLFVSVAETRLSGAADFRIANGFHSQLPKSESVHQWIVSFIKNGYFTTSVERQPINDTSE